MCLHSAFEKQEAEMQSDRKMLRDDQWEKIEALLPGKVGDPARSGENNRQFVEAVLWIVRTSSPWRDLPAELGNWHTIYMRVLSAGVKQVYGKK